MTCPQLTPVTSTLARPLAPGLTIVTSPVTISTSVTQTETEVSVT